MAPSGFVTHAVRVVVPASSANLGPGFDAMGLALGIHDEITAMITDDQGIRIHVEGEGVGELPTDETHLVAQAMNLGFATMNKIPAGYVINCRNAIPHGRGLGSSAAAIIGGLAVARELVEGGSELLPDTELLNIALSMEGHPDNVSASLYGGFTVSWLESPAVAGSVSIKLHPDVIPIVAVPPNPLATSMARDVLDGQVLRSDATHNVARAGLLVHAMSANPEYLFPATADALHQDARAHIYPETTALIALLRAQNIAAVVSGAGPAVLMLIDKSQPAQLEVLAGLLPADWTSVAVPVDQEGVRRVEIPG
jgi:homoserine kinase